jgi:glutamyl-tRNA synthetase
MLRLAARAMPATGHGCPSSLHSVRLIPVSQINRIPFQLRFYTSAINSKQQQHRTMTECALHTHTHCCPAYSSEVSSANTSSSTSAPSVTATTPTSGVRVRYAPSPTGSVHLGGLRTALYNYLFAKKLHPPSITSAATASPSDVSASSPGQFLLRIEDTDQKRLVPGAVDELIHALRWAGVENDEGPGASAGDCGPYVQSERLHLYKEHVDKLLVSGHAYPCFCTAERLNDLREMQTKKGLSSMYDRLCLGMSEEERTARLKECKEQNIPYVVRMKIPHGSTAVRDLIRGVVHFPNKTLDDQVLLKSDGFPTYHLACVVDDHLMRISHVIRGDEWLTSTPKHVLLYRAFGWSVPQFAHLPLLLKPDGTKLSKRHADSSLEYYIQRGYLPEAVLNFVALLGWNPGTTQEVFTREQLIDSFTLDRIQKAGAVVNLEKLNWFNQQHIQRIGETIEGLDRLIQLVRPHLIQFHQQQLTGTEMDTSSQSSRTALERDLQDISYLRRIIASLLPHVTHVHDFAVQSAFYFRAPNFNEETSVQFKTKIFTDTNTNQLNSQSYFIHIHTKTYISIQLFHTAILHL